MAVLPALAWPVAAGAAPSARARKIAADFVVKHCPSFDPAAMDELAAIFQRRINRRIDNGRVQVMPVQRYAAAMEIATLAEWCKRPGLRAIRALNAPAGAKTPDFQAEFDVGPGVQFWRELEALYGDRPDLACFSVRQWIVPLPATVYTDRDELYILDAPLTVKMQSEFVGGLPGGGCPQHDQAFETQKEEINKRLILPSVIHAVNTAPQFADLRRVYLSRVAAAWFRARHAGDRTPVGRIAGSGDIGRWPSTIPWNPLDVFNRYLHSVRHGEWTVNRRVRVNGHDYVLSTVFGGVDFSRTPRVRVSRRQFRARWPRLAGRVERSLHGRTTDAQGEVWLGGTAG